MQFKPSPTAMAFMASRAFIKLICGPVGGGKSTAALWALWCMALEQVAFNGVRRTKFILLRNTMQQLKTTVKPLIEQWFVELPVLQYGSALGTWRLSENVFEIRVRLPDGTIVHSEFYLMAADTPDDVRRLLSLECSAAWVEEAREVDAAVFEGLQGRVARFPNRQSGGVTYPCVICSTNPPPVGTYWHELMTNPPKNAEVFMQPAALLEDGALNPEAENLENLDPNYYANLVEGKTEDWIAVYLKNKFGAGGFGQPVFKGTFRKDFHVSKLPLAPIPVGMKKIIVGSDNGLTAAAVIGQEDAMGRINILADAYVPDGETMGYDRFLDTILIPKLRDLKVPTNRVLFMVDPACFHRSQATEITIAQVIKKRGFEVLPAPTNQPERRVAAVESLLMQQVGGGPRLRFSPNAKHTVQALDWGFRNKKTASGQSTATPEKNFFSHVGDAVQYFALFFAAGASEGENRSRVRTVERKQFVYS